MRPILSDWPRSLVWYHLVVVCTVLHSAELLSVGIAHHPTTLSTHPMSHSWIGLFLSLAIYSVCVCYPGLLMPLIQYFSSSREILQSHHSRLDLVTCLQQSGNFLYPFSPWLLGSKHDWSWHVQFSILPFLLNLFLTFSEEILCMVYYAKKAT